MKERKKLDIKILYVEDEQLVRETIYEMLNRRIENVIVAADGQEGLEKYHSENPAIIITDIKMPNMDGLEMISQIKEDNIDVPIIITSAHSESQYFIKAIDLGIANFVMKPVKNRDLFKLIKKIYDTLNYQKQAKLAEEKRKVAERNLRESQEQIRAIFENAVVGMGIIDSDFQLIFSNKALARMLYEDEYSLLSHSIEEYLKEDSLTMNRIRNASGKDATGRVTRFQSEEELVLKEGETLWVEISVSTIISADNKISKFVIIVNDINERKKSQEERDELYNSLLSELETAASVQSFFLPDWIGIEEEILYSNNYTPSTNVGGDLFDIIPLGESRYLVYVGDISGHGVQGALIMTAVKATIKMLVDKSNMLQHPSEIIGQLNSLLTKDLFHNNYMTLVLGIIDVKKKQMVYYNAGHPPIIRYNKSTNEAEILPSIGAIPIGWMHDYNYTWEEENTLHLDESSSYLLYTDGIFECNDPMENELGINGILEILKQCDHRNSTIMLPNILKQSIINEGFDISTDDFTILSLNLRNLDDSMLRYYIMNPLRDSTGDIGKRCEEFLRSQDLDELAFSAELLINEFLNKIIEDNPDQSWENTIVLRLKLHPDKLEITIWDKGIEWDIPVNNENQENPEDTFNGMFIIKNLIHDIERKRLVDVNETNFTLKIQSKKKSLLVNE